jgi:hypothetical protein
MTLEQLIEDIKQLTAQRDQLIGQTNQIIGALRYAQGLREQMEHPADVAKTEPTT